MPPPKVYLGTGNWAKHRPEEEQGKLLPLMKELGIRQIDTAPIYPIHKPQEAEKLIGKFNLGAKGVLIDSKILYFGNGEGTLSAEAIQKSLDQSLANLKVDKLNILYCHGPDRKTPIADQAAALDAEFKKGKFRKLGVCNFEQGILEEWLQIAEEKGYVKPSVFQGQYNLLCRTYEESLIPFLRKHDIAFVGFSPLAGGYLTGKLTSSSGPEELKGTRFEISDTNYLGMGYRKWYDKPSMHSAVRKMQELCKAHDVEMLDAACRWVLYHSILDGGPVLSREKGDAVIVGPKSLEQLETYAHAYMQGPLSGELVKGLNGLWDGVKEDAKSIIVF